ncbi:MAG TPA: hypothetical protein DIS79_05685 [Bacteroidetes bacterium]|nr:hypothetical protein [Bacteroidota bacterium]HRK04901.1 DUF4835 family protein [Chlorobiota bacterium]
MKIRLITVLVVCWLPFVTVHGQELDPNVVVNLESIPLDQRPELQSMANDVRTYLTNNRFTGEDWEGPKIPIDINIFVLAKNGNRVTARLALVSKRLVNNQPGTGAGLLRIYDQEWEFEWTFNPVLTFQPLRYDHFTSVIDFYALLAIGLDMDTYDDLGGTEVYKVAQQIAQAGGAQGVRAFRTFYQPGEFVRTALVAELLDLRYEGFRRLLFDYHDGIDQMSKDADGGRALVAQTISDMANFKKTKVSNRSLLMQVFFDAKHLEIAEIFRGRKNDPVWADLKFLDPGNTQAYETARNG